LHAFKGALIGDPVVYSISHKIYPELFEKYGLNGSFEKIQVKKGCLEQFFRRDLGLDFITVTMPHKIDVIPFCDELSEDAKMIGCVNYILVRGGRRIGHNFDGYGSLNEIEKVCLVKEKSVLVVGAGGAARAAIVEAKKRGGRVYCMNRSVEKGIKVSKELGAGFISSVEGKSFDVIINATPIGMDSTDMRSLISDIDVYRGATVLDMASRDGNCLLRRQVESKDGLYISGSKMFLNLTLESLMRFFVISQKINT